MMPLLLALTIAFAILAWLDLHKALMLLVAVLPSYLLRTEIFGVPTTLLELLVLTYLLVWIFKRRIAPLSKIGSPPFPRGANPPTPRLRRAGGGLPTGVAAPMLLLFASSISIFTSPDPTVALGIWKAYFVEPMILFFILRYELRNARLSPDTLFQALGISAIILSLITVIQWVTGHGIPIPWDIERRVTSVFDYPNAVGLFLGPIAVIASLQKKLLWLVVAIFSFLAIVLAQSEAAIVSVVATWLIAGLVYRDCPRMRDLAAYGHPGTPFNVRSSTFQGDASPCAAISSHSETVPYRKTRIWSASILTLLILLILLTPPWQSKLTLRDYSGEVRRSQWSETVDMLEDHWLFGAGLSGYPIVFQPYHQATHIEIFQYPHNIVLNIWVELGLLGLLAFAFLGWQVLNATRYTLHATRFTLHASQTLAFLALLQMTIHGLVDVPYFKNDLAMLTWILLAIIFAYVPAIDTHQKKTGS